MAENDNMRILAAKARSGDQDAFIRLYEMVYTDLYKSAYYTLGNREDAEDAVSETVMDAYGSISRLRDESAFRAWIFAILSNKCKRMIRQRVNASEASSGLSPEDIADTVGNADPGMSEVLGNDEVRCAFSVLSDEERMIVTMTVYGKYSSKEIGKNLGLKPATVRSKYSRALAKMRARISSETGSSISGEVSK